MHSHWPWPSRMGGGHTDGNYSSQLTIDYSIGSVAKYIWNRAMTGWALCQSKLHFFNFRIFKPFFSMSHSIIKLHIQCDGLADCCQITMIPMSQALPDMRIGDTVTSRSQALEREFQLLTYNRGSDKCHQLTVCKPKLMWEPTKALSRHDLYRLLVW